MTGMEWLKSVIADFQSLGMAIFALIVTFMAISQLRERRLLGILLLILSVGILGFLVINPTVAIEKISAIFSK